MWIETMRVAFFSVSFFTSFCCSSTHSLDYKFNRLCIISMVASFSFTFYFFHFVKLFESTPFWRRFFYLCLRYVFFSSSSSGQVIRIRHRRWFCQLHQLPFLVFATNSGERISQATKPPPHHHHTNHTTQKQSKMICYLIFKQHLIQFSKIHVTTS